MSLPLPDVPESECTPLVRQLLDLLQQQQEIIQQLRDEIARLKGLKTRPLIRPVLSKVLPGCLATPVGSGPVPPSGTRPPN